MMMLAAAGLAVSPVASNAAASLSIARAAPQMSGASFLQDDEHHGNRTAMVALGGLLLVLIIVVAIAGDSGNKAENPHSP
jgi:hypothetical protein